MLGTYKYTVQVPGCNDLDPQVIVDPETLIVRDARRWTRPRSATRMVGSFASRWQYPCATCAGRLR